MYVYSKEDALQSFPLTNPGTAVAFTPEGSFAFISGGGIADGLSTYTTCTAAAGLTVGTPSAPSIVAPLGDGSQVVALEPPNLDLISVNVNVTPPFTSCAPPMNLSLASSTNLGLGSFTPSQMIISPDGTKAYIVSSSFSSIVVFDIVGQTTSAIQLSGNTESGAGSAFAGRSGACRGCKRWHCAYDQHSGGWRSDAGDIPSKSLLNSAGQPYSTVCKPNTIIAKP